MELKFKKGGRLQTKLDKDISAGLQRIVGKLKPKKKPASEIKSTEKKKKEEKELKEKRLEEWKKSIEKQFGNR